MRARARVCVCVSVSVCQCVCHFLFFYFFKWWWGFLLLFFVSEQSLLASSSGDVAGGKLALKDLNEILKARFLAHLSRPGQALSQGQGVPRSSPLTQLYHSTTAAESRTSQLNHDLRGSPGSSLRFFVSVVSFVVKLCLNLFFFF